MALTKEKGSPDSLDFQKAVHLVIDVQYDYCSLEGGLTRIAQTGLDMTPMVEVAKRIDDFIKATRHVLKPVWIRTEECTETLAQNLKWLHNGKLPWVLCKTGSHGYDYFLVKPEPGEKEIHKVHYSGFHNPELKEYLKENDIETILYSGVMASRCVYTTMVSGSALGFKSIIIEDLVENPTELHSEKLEFMKVAGFLFAKMIKSEKILEMIRKQLGERV